MCIEQWTVLCTTQFLFDVFIFSLLWFVGCGTKVVHFAFRNRPPSGMNGGRPLYRRCWNGFEAPLPARQRRGGDTYIHIYTKYIYLPAWANVFGLAFFSVMRSFLFLSVGCLNVEKRTKEYCVSCIGGGGMHTWGSEFCTSDFSTADNTCCLRDGVTHFLQPRVKSE